MNWRVPLPSEISYSNAYLFNLLIVPNALTSSGKYFKHNQEDISFSEICSGYHGLLYNMSINLAFKSVGKSHCKIPSHWNTISKNLILSVICTCKQLNCALMQYFFVLSSSNTSRAILHLLQFTINICYFWEICCSGLCE